MKIVLVSLRDSVVLTVDSVKSFSKQKIQEHCIEQTRRNPYYAIILFVNFVFGLKQFIYLFDGVFENDF